MDEARNRRVERGHVERHDTLIALLGKIGDQCVTDLAIGSGNQHDWLTHPSP
jgi:hypothetical protein